MCIVATTECFFESSRSTCAVWWGGAEREADLHQVSHFDGTRDWFAFPK